MHRHLLVFGTLILSLFSVGLVSAQQATDLGEQDITPEQAISRLTELVDFYDVSLTTPERDIVLSTCRQLQLSNLQDTRTKVLNSRAKYQEAMLNVDQNIRFTANSLRNMSEDSSSMDIASFNLGKLRNNFNTNIRLFERSVDQLLVLDCQVFPELFVAGLRDARTRQAVSIKDASDIKDFIDEDLSRAFDNVKSRLTDIEGPQ